MIKQENQKSFLNQLNYFFKSNAKLVIIAFFTIILLFIFSQYYFYQKENKIYELSLLFDQEKNNYNSENFEETMNLIANENGIFSILANLEIIKKNLINKNYSLAYLKYLEILNKNSSKNIYNSLISLHGSYNLVDHISSEQIINLLSFVDESYVNFIGYREEINYLLAIKNKDSNQRDLLFKQILNNENITNIIKDRIRKLNEFEKYK